MSRARADELRLKRWRDLFHSRSAGCTAGDHGHGVPVVAVPKALKVGGIESGLTSI
jgi:hypothetical protein